MLNKLRKNKKGQASESITWIVATIILIAVLLIFIYASITLSKVKSINFKIKSNSENSFDWIGKKTEMAYLINSANKDRIEEWIAQEGKNE